MGAACSGMLLPVLMPIMILADHYSSGVAVSSTLAGQYGESSVPATRISCWLVQRPASQKSV